MKAKIINIFSVLFSFYKIIRYSNFFPSIRGIKINAESCSILGNGPSLLDDIGSEIDYLQQQDLFVVNFFANSDLFFLLKPRYYILADPAFHTQDLPKNLKEKMRSLFDIIENKVDWNMILIVPCRNIAFFRQKLSGNHCIELMGYNAVDINCVYAPFDNWAHDKQLAVLGSMNVVNVAAYLAVYMGYKKIHLLGVDHSWHNLFRVNSMNQVIRIDPHFSDKCTPQEFVNKEKIHEELENSAKALKTYHLVQIYAQHRGSVIYTCCERSFIDAFPRKSLKEVVEQERVGK